MVYCVICAKSFTGFGVLCPKCHLTFPDVKSAFFCDRCGIYLNRPLLNHRCRCCQKCGLATMNKRLCVDCWVPPPKPVLSSSD